MALIDGGFIILSRKLIESEIWRKPPLYLKVWIYLLSRAQHKPYKQLDRGQLRTSIPDIIEDCSWYVGYRKEKPTKDQVYQVINWLRKVSEEVNEEGAKAPMITTTKATQGLLINIVNYDYYQTPKNYESNRESNDEEGTKATSEQRQPDNINKNDKNVNNENNLLLLSISKEFPNFYKWIEENNYTKEAEHPNDKPYYLKYLHEKANFYSKTKGKEHIDTINAIKAFENKKSTETEEVIFKAQSIS